MTTAIASDVCRFAVKEVSCDFEISGLEGQRSGKVMIQAKNSDSLN